MLFIEIQKAENGFVIIAYPEIEKKNVKYYIAKDSGQIGEICKKLVDNYEEIGEKED